MALACPACGTKLAASSIRSHFVCPKCAANLCGKATGPTIVGIALWAAADLVIYPVVHVMLGDTLTAHLVRYGLSGCIGIPLVMALISEFGEVTLDDTEKS
jgi:hypothetical protein